MSHLSRPPRPGEGRPRTRLLTSRRRAFLHALTATGSLKRARLDSGLTEAQAWRLLEDLETAAVHALTAHHPTVQAQAA